MSTFVRRGDIITYTKEICVWTNLSVSSILQKMQNIYLLLLYTRDSPEPVSLVCSFKTFICYCCILETHLSLYHLSVHSKHLSVIVVY
jgi:hypothetical protein